MKEHSDSIHAVCPVSGAPLPSNQKLYTKAPLLRRQNQRFCLDAPQPGQTARILNHESNFYGREFVINSDVLIPRPETEMMIDTVLNLVGKPYLPGVKPGEAKLPEDLTIVDVGTGSGCVAATLKLELPKAEVIASDVSEKALKVARENARRLGAQVEFLPADLLEGVEVKPDLVVANLPYVDENWEWIDKETLSHEPRLALYAEDRGMALIKQLINQVAEREIKHLVLEADPCQHEEICSFARKKGLKLIETRGFVFYLSV